MSVRDDAIFLAGFIMGTYDLRDDATPPACIMPFIDRVLKSPSEEVRNSKDTTPWCGPNMGAGEALLRTEEQVEKIRQQKRNAAPQADIEDILVPVREHFKAKLEETEEISENVTEREENDENLSNSTGLLPSGKKERKKPELSEEVRKAASERMKKMQADKKARREAEKNNTAYPGQMEKHLTPKPYVPVPSERLLTDHNEYAGKRDPKQELEDSDWPDIKDMLHKKQMTMRAIAADYDVEFDVLRKFIDRMHGK